MLPLMQSPYTSAKSIFKSKTFWGAVFTAIVGIAPLAGQIATRREETGRWDWDKAAAIVAILAGTGATVAGRVSATDRVFTPEGLPGPNKDDLAA